MAAHELAVGKSDEWYTPAYVFDALGVRFDLDVAAPRDLRLSHVPADRVLTIEDDGLVAPWSGFVWMNPPFGKRMGLEPWLRKFFEHGCGIALVPDRSSAPWWQAYAPRAAVVLFVAKKIKFERPDGSVGKQPGTGTCLLACGPRAVSALDRARRAGLGPVFVSL